MDQEKKTAQPKKKNCQGCGGSGQISFFRGVSRFVMDWDDCPDCHGTGYVEEPNHSQEGEKTNRAGS